MSFNKHWGQVSSKQGRKIKVSYDITPPCEGAGDPTCNGKFNTKIFFKKNRPVLMVLFMKKGDFSARFDFRRVYRPFWMVKSQWLLRSCRFNPIFLLNT